MQAGTLGNAVISKLIFASKRFVGLIKHLAVIQIREKNIISIKI